MMIRTLAVVSFAFLATSIVGAQVSGLKLGYVKRTASESGCSVFRNLSDEQNDRPLFLGLSDETGYIKLNGQTLKLLPVSASKEKRVERVGDRSWKTYAGRRVSVRMDFTVTYVCAPNDEQCEATHYNAIFTIRRGARQIIVRGVAMCGS